MKSEMMSVARRPLLSLVAAVFGCYLFVAAPTENCRGQEMSYENDFDGWEESYSEGFGEPRVEIRREFGNSEFEDLPPAMQALVLGVMALVVVVMLGIFIFILWLLHGLLKALPPEYRLLEPALVWLLLIPCFNIIWNFYVYPRISRSYQSFFNSYGRTDVGDCGAGLGIAYAVCVLLASIPCVNYITGIFCAPAMIVLIILYLVRLRGLMREIDALLMKVPSKGQSPFTG